MKPRHLNLMLTVLVSLMLPASTLAVPRHHHTKHHAVPTTQAILALALADAEEYWKGPLPCGGNVTFREVPTGVTRLPIESVDPTETSEELQVWSEWSDYGTYQIKDTYSPTGYETSTSNFSDQEGPQFDASHFTDCVIVYTPRAYANSQEMLRYWPMLAHDVAHEVQHFENRWYLETPTDYGSRAVDTLSPNEVAYPYFTGHNAPLSALRHKPAGARNVCCTGASEPE